MKNLTVQLRKQDKYLLGICLFGFFLRVVFMYLGAGMFWGRDNIYVDGDTFAWAGSIENLIKHGTYTIAPGDPYGYYGRMPGYSFFIGIFYLLTGMNWTAAYPLIAWVQILMDVVSVMLLYGITLKLTDNRKASLIPALLYATYPFIIVWNPVAYSETLGNFLMILTLWFFVSEKIKRNFLYSGISLGLALLTRPQTALLFPFLGLALFWRFRRQLRKMTFVLLQFGGMVLMVYGAWPARNYLLHHRLVFTQEMKCFSNWSEDVVSFMQYIFSVKAEWEPQYSAILQNKPVTFPREAYLSREDSLMLEEAVSLSKTCGSGFSFKKGYWKEPVTGANCNQRISQLFNELREHQIRDNPWNFWVKVPLKNLQKALFKFQLYDSASAARKAASLLFLYRTFLIVLGLAGLSVMFRAGPAGQITAAVFLGYFLATYLLLCAGTSPQMRNIEMRYFLPPDTLLLIPAGLLIYRLLWRSLVRQAP